MDLVLVRRPALRARFRDFEREQLRQRPTSLMSSSSTVKPEMTGNAGLASSGSETSLKSPQTRHTRC